MNKSLVINYIRCPEQLTNVCREKNVYIYGAGKHASRIHKLLKLHQISIAGFLVSSMKGNRPEKEGKSVMQANMLKDKNAVVVFAICVKSEEECRSIVVSEIQEIYFYEEELYNDELTNLLKSLFKKTFFDDRYEIIENGLVEKWHILCRYRNDGNSLVFRVPLCILNNNSLNILRKKVEMTDLCNLFEECYGSFRYLPETIQRRKKAEKTYSIYMARCHVDKMMDIPELPDWIIPIQTGAALTETVLCDIRDNQGDNISNRNRDYSECTAIYWIWKNAKKTDYIGLCHYRRHFYIPNDEISVIASCDYDILTTVPTINANNYDYFRQFVTEEDINTLCQAIKILYPEFYNASQQYYKSIFCPPCNMFIMKYEVFQEYAQFVFCIAFEIDEHYRKKGIVRNDRYMGFLIENLTDIFLIKNKNKYKIGYTNMKFLG